jgi:2-oxoglutarate ferredoxin oxidoreductase subunit delta
MPTQSLNMGNMRSRKIIHQRTTEFIRVDNRSCDACWDCIEACPKQVLGKIDVIWHRHVIIRNAAACNGCKKCVRACERGAIEYTYIAGSQAAEQRQNTSFRR